MRRVEFPAPVDDFSVMRLRGTGGGEVEIMPTLILKCVIHKYSSGCAPAFYMCGAHEWVRVQGEVGGECVPTHPPLLTLRSLKSQRPPCFGLAYSSWDNQLRRGLQAKRAVSK